MSGLGVWRVSTTAGDFVRLLPRYDSFESGTTLLTCLAVEGVAERDGPTVWVNRAHIVLAWREEAAP